MRHALALFVLFLMLAPAVAAEQAKAPPLTPEAFFAAVLANAENGQARAMLDVGSLYEQGLGVPRNFTRALEWYARAAYAGETEGWLRLGFCFEVGMGTAADMGKAVAYYEEAARAGSPAGEYKMASLYLLGRGLPKDEARGFALLRKSAEAGEGAACNELAAVYLNGLFGQPKDAAAALAWFRKGAEHGNLTAMKNLAVMHKDGAGGRADPAEALRWYLSARKCGLWARDLDAAIGTLKQQCAPAQVKKAEVESDAWAAGYAERQRQKAQTAGK
jgi:TPR repeat protein